jgi:hypothetical protein
LLKRRFGIILSKVLENHEAQPDFEYIRDGQRVFVAELKDIEYHPPSEQRGWTIPKPDEKSHRFSHKTDNAVSRVADKIHDAFRQLKTSPPPRILILLNGDSMVDVKDLEEAFTGQHVYGSEAFSYVNVVSKKIAEGKIREEKSKIDLYIWIERRNEKIQFRYPTQVGHNLAHSLFPAEDKDQNN